MSLNGKIHFIAFATTHNQLNIQERIIYIYKKAV